MTKETKLKLWLLFFFLFFLIGMNALFTFQLQYIGKDKSELVDHTHEVIIETKNFLGSMQDAETGQRGYLLTLDESYLEPYKSGIKKAKVSFKYLSSLTADNPIQQERLKSINKLMNLKLDELKMTIALGDKAIDIVKQNYGKKYMDEIRAHVKTFIELEVHLLKERKNKNTEHISNVIWLIRSMSFFVFSILFYFIYRTIKQKNALEFSKTKALEALKTKSEFLANMSHEIRTPLNAVLGFIDLLKDKTKDETSLKYLDIIDNSSNSLLNIIEDILDFSKIESRKLDIDKIDFDTKAEFEVITHLFNAKCSAKEITLILHIDEDVPKYLNTDPFRIKQVISNLLSNAIKFTDSGKKITLGINYKDGILNISVKDEGKGIAEDKQEHIFSAFGQEDSSTTRSYGGTGLGLSISRSLVELLGGELTLKSELGVGSEFSFSIPVKTGNIPNNKVENEEEVLLSGNVLLVEDNKTNQMLMQILLDEIGLEYDIANDGLEAIEKFKNNSYDVILMDENMPNMRGIEATAHIIDIEEKNSLSHTPIIALTANALKGDREKFLNAGMDEYRTKPLNKKILIEVLNKVMKSS